MTTIFFHSGNGHNYSVDVKGKKSIMYRYYTNGHENRNYEKSKTVETDLLSTWLGLDLNTAEKYNPILKEIAESVWFTKLK